MNLVKKTVVWITDDLTSGSCYLLYNMIPSRIHLKTMYFMERNPGLVYARVW